MLFLIINFIKNFSKSIATSSAFNPFKIYLRAKYLIIFFI